VQVLKDGESLKKSISLTTRLKIFEKQSIAKKVVQMISCYPEMEERFFSINWVLESFLYLS